VTELKGVEEGKVKEQSDGSGGVKEGKVKERSDGSEGCEGKKS
jgi:hypothetical protein